MAVWHTRNTMQHASVSHGSAWRLRDVPDPFELAGTWRQRVRAPVRRKRVPGRGMRARPLSRKNDAHTVEEWKPGVEFIVN